MRQRASATFQRERAQFGLCFTCESCTYFDPDDGRCTHGYPNAEHRTSPEDEAPLVFCKEFDLR